MKSPVHIERSGATLDILLNRSERRNALARDMVAALNDAFHNATADAGVWTIILSGAPPAFSAGLDLDEVAASAARRPAHDTSDLYALFEQIANCPKPVIAAAIGPALAGGAALLTVADIVVCGESARVGYPGIRHGLAAAVVMPYLLRVVSARRARYLLLTGDLLTADQAVQYGLADEVVPDASVVARARHYASMLNGYGPAVLIETKALLARVRALGDAGSHEDLAQLCGRLPLGDSARRLAARLARQ
jgi:methylglutaconyl-CoA hydratase